MKDGFKLGFTSSLAIVGVFVTVILIGSMSIFGWGLFQRSTANFRGQTSAIEQTKANASFRLSSYNHFFDLCSVIQGEEGRIAAQTQLLSSSAGADATRVSTNIAALQGQRTADINQYNADAAKSFTQGQFRDSKLPYQIDTQGEKTTCVIN